MKRNILLFSIGIIILFLQTAAVSGKDLVTSMTGASKSDLYNWDSSLRKSCPAEKSACVIMRAYIKELGSDYFIPISAGFESPDYREIKKLFIVLTNDELRALGYPENSTGAGDLAAELLGLGYENRYRIEEPNEFIRQSMHYLYVIFPDQRAGCQVFPSGSSYHVDCRYPYTSFTSLKDIK